jgi:hypothetical protein
MSSAPARIARRAVRMKALARRVASVGCPIKAMTKAARGLVARRLARGRATAPGVLLAGGTAQLVASMV